MRVSTMVRWSTAIAAAVLATACADTSTAPPKVTPPPSGLSGKALEGWLLDNGGVSRDGRGRDNKTNDKYSGDFTIDPTQPATLNAGGHIVTFPANSICDPATSGYGPNLWDSPCTPLTTPITIHASWNSKNGHAFVDFQPSLRFVPTSDPSQYVTISMKDYWDLDPSGDYPLFWLNPADSTWVDESVYDPSMSSVMDLQGNRVSRRLKHFSGYLVANFNEVCDVWSSTSCAPVTSFSGYLVGM
jgi:hypothetical protein